MFRCNEKCSPARETLLDTLMSKTRVTITQTNTPSRENGLLRSEVPEGLGVPASDQYHVMTHPFLYPRTSEPFLIRPIRDTILKNIGDVGDLDIILSP
jgi:hypothetical protein